jgi:DNA recombination-dependent growth factor C
MLESEAKSEVQSFSDQLTQRAKSEVYSVASEEEEILDTTIIHALRTSLDKEIERMEDKMIHTAEEDLSPEIKRIKEDIEVIDNI